jgi:hypothetical protein
MKLTGIGRSLEGPIMIMPNWFREKDDRYAFAVTPDETGSVLPGEGSPGSRSRPIRRLRGPPLRRFWQASGKTVTTSILAKAYSGVVPASLRPCSSWVANMSLSNVSSAETSTWPVDFHAASATSRAS